MLSEREQLLSILPPPAGPVPRVDWDKETASLGFSLPADYRWFCDTYGPGTIGKYAWIIHPWDVPGGGLARYILNVLPSIIEFIKENKEKEDPFDEVDYFDPTRLIPFRGTDNFELFVWVATGEPDQWRVMSFDIRDGLEESEEIGMVPFLLSLLTGRSRLLGDFVAAEWFQSPQFIPKPGSQAACLLDFQNLRKAMLPVEPEPEFLTEPGASPSTSTLPAELQWDKSHKWVVYEWVHQLSRVTIPFAGPNPTLAELMALRKGVPALRDVPPSTLKTQLAGKGCYKLEPMKTKEAEDAVRWLKHNGLSVVVEDASYSEIVPYDETDKDDWILPDQEQAKRVARAMKAEGIKVKRIKR